MKLSEAEIALLLERVRATHPEEARRLSGHLSLLAVSDNLTSLVREVTAAVNRAQAAEERTSEMLAGWTTTMTSLSTVLNNILHEEKRRNDADQQRFALEERRIASEEKTRTERIRGVFAPIVSAIVSAIGTAAGFYWSRSP